MLILIQSCWVLFYFDLEPTLNFLASGIYFLQLQRVDLFLQLRLIH